MTQNHHQLTDSSKKNWYQNHPRFGAPNQETLSSNHPYLFLPCSSCHLAIGWQLKSWKPRMMQLIFPMRSDEWRLKLNPSNSLSTAFFGPWICGKWREVGANPTHSIRWATTGAVRIVFTIYVCCDYLKLMISLGKIPMIESKKIFKKFTPCNRGTPITWVTPAKSSTQKHQQSPHFYRWNSITLSLEEGLGVDGLWKIRFQKLDNQQRSSTAVAKPEFLMCTFCSSVSLGWKDFHGKCFSICHVYPLSNRWRFWFSTILRIRIPLHHSTWLNSWKLQ